MTSVHASGRILVLSLVSVLVASGCATGTGGDTTLPPTSTTVATTTSLATTTTTQAELPETTVIADPHVLAVPTGAPPSIDGTIESGEWDGAVTSLMDDGAPLHWLYADGALYVGITQHTIGAINVVVADDDRIRVLHSSAALGSALYSATGDGAWQLDHGYEWCCRSGSSATGRASLLAEEGWDANIGFAGQPGHVEYLIEASEGELLIAVVFIGPDGPEAFWPADLPEASRESLYGQPEDQESFATDTWMRVVIGG